MCAELLILGTRGFQGNGIPEVSIFFSGGRAFLEFRAVDSPF